LLSVNIFDYYVLTTENHLEMNTIVEVVY
jgi:hypothetical protein